MWYSSPNYCIWEGISSAWCENELIHIYIIYASYWIKYFSLLLNNSRKLQCYQNRTNKHDSVYNIICDNIKL